MEQKLSQPTPAQKSRQEERGGDASQIRDQQLTLEAIGEDKGRSRKAGKNNSQGNERIEQKEEVNRRCHSISY